MLYEETYSPYHLFPFSYYTNYVSAKLNSQEEEKEKTESDGSTGFGDTSGGFGTGFPAGTSSPFQKTSDSEKWIPVNIWTSISFIQIDKKEMDAVEKQIGFKLDPEDGKLYLNLEEKKKLMPALEKAKSFEILASGSVLSISGQQGYVKLAEEIRYPIAAEVEEQKDGKSKFKEPDFQDDMSGLTISLTPTANEKGDVITLVCFPEYRFFHGWLKFNAPFNNQPVFSLLSHTATWYMKDGSTSVVKMVLPKPVQVSHTLTGTPPVDNLQPKVCLLLCSVKVINVEPLKKQLIHFIECVQKRENPLPDGKSGVNVVKVLEAVDASIKENGKPISLRW